MQQSSNWIVVYGPTLASILTTFGVGGIAIYFLKNFVSETKQGLKDLNSKAIDHDKAFIHINTNIKSNKAAVEALEKHLIEKVAEIKGASDDQRKTLKEAIENLTTTNNSLEKLWVVLRMLHPDKIPERLIDKRRQEAGG